MKMKARYDICLQCLEAGTICDGHSLDLIWFYEDRFETQEVLKKIVIPDDCPYILEYLLLSETDDDILEDEQREA